MTFVLRTGPWIANLGSFDTLAELITTHPAAQVQVGTQAYTADSGWAYANGTTWGPVGGSAATFSATAVETANSLVPVTLSYPVGHAWRYLSSAQIADAVARTQTLDQATGLNNAITAAFVSGTSMYIPGGVYKVATSLAMPGVLSSRDTRGDAFVMHGDGAGDPFSVIGFTNATVIVGSGTTIPLISTPGGGAGTGTGNAYIRDIRFEGNNTTQIFNVTVWSDSVMERCTFLQGGTGDGITIAWNIGNTFRDVMVMNSGKVTTGGVKTGTGINITQAGGDAGLNTIEHSIFCGWLNCIQVGDGSHAIENTKITDCAVQAATNGIVIGVGANKTVLDNIYSENISGTIIKDNGNATTIRDGFFFPGFLIGIDASAIGNGSTPGGTATYSGNVFNINGANCIGMKLAAQAWYETPTPNTSIVDGNFFFFANGSQIQTGITISGISPNIFLRGNQFYPVAPHEAGANTNEIIDTSTGLGVIGQALTIGASNKFPLMANVGWQPAWTGVPLTASSVSAGTMTLPPESVIALNEPSAATSVSAFATTKARVVTFYGNFNGKFTFTSGATVTLARPWNSPFGTLTLWMYDGGGGVMNAFEIGRSEYTPGGAVTQLSSRTTGVTLSKTQGAITMFSAAGSATAATFVVTNTLVVNTDTILLNQVSGTNLYNLHVTAIGAGTFNVTFYTTGGTATDAPVINFAVIKGSS